MRGRVYENWRAHIGHPVSNYLYKIKCMFSNTIDLNLFAVPLNFIECVQ